MCPSWHLVAGMHEWTLQSHICIYIYTHTHHTVYPTKNTLLISVCLFSCILESYSYLFFSQKINGRCPKSKSWEWQTLSHRGNQQAMVIIEQESRRSIIKIQDSSIGFGASLQISEPWSNKSLRRSKSFWPLRSPIHKHLHWKSLHLSHFVAGQAQHWKRPVTKTTTVVSLLFVLRIYGWYPLNRFKDYWPMDEIGWIQINPWMKVHIYIYNYKIYFTLRTVKV